MSSFKHRDRKRTSTMASSRALGSLGLRTPEQVALWARKHGLLSVYLVSLPVHGFQPACWQVVRPGYKTAEPTAPFWHRGNKTFVFKTSKDRPLAERKARTWASAHFNADSWVKVEGIAGALFPDVVGDSLQAVNPDIIIARDRHVAKAWTES